MGVRLAVAGGILFWSAVFLVPWGIVLALALTVHPALGLVASIGSIFYLWWLGKKALRYTLFRVKEGVQENEAPQVALPTLRGVYLPMRLKRAGIRFFFPPFPAYYRAIPIDINRRNQDIPVMVRTDPRNEGAEAELVLAFTWIPDHKQPSRLPRYLLYRDKGIAEQLKDVAGRHGIGVAASMGWQDFYRSLGDVANHIVADVTRPRGCNNTDALARLEPRDGAQDKFGWGIRIVRVRPKSVTLKGEFGKIADKLAREFQERRAELEDQRTVEALSKIVAGQGADDAKLDDARRLIMLARAKDGQAALAHAALALRKEMAEAIIRFLHKPS